MMTRQHWGWRDRRTGQRVSMSGTITREQAERQLEEWRARDAQGKRPDLHDLIPHIEVYLVWERESAPDGPKAS